MENVIEAAGTVTLEAWKRLGDELDKGKVSDMTGSYLRALALYRGLLKVQRDRFRLERRIAEDLLKQ
jgi:hypothetical protein